MAETLTKDISRWQGGYSETPEPIIMVKISGGDLGLYIDPQAANNYNQVIAHGHAFGGYHFAGGGDPVGEADFFLNAMRPWNPGEVPALDWEIQHPDPVGWCLAFVNRVHDQTGAWPLVYMNRATLMAHDWTPVLNNCGLWLADWTGSPDGDIDTGSYTYVMQQYNDGPVYDRDVFFGTVDQFKQYGWPAVAPFPAPSPDVAPAPAITPAPVVPPVVLPDMTNNVPVTPIASPQQVASWPKPPAKHWKVLDLLIQLWEALFKRKK